MLTQNLFINPWFIVETLKISFRYQLDQILVSLLVFAEDDQVVWPAVGGISIMPAGLGDIHFAADDRLDSSFFRSLVEANRAEQISVVGDCNRGHFVFCRGFCKGVVVAGAIEEAKARMKMQVNER